KSFATPEYEVFRYSAILAAKQVSNGAFKTLMRCLPTLEQIKNSIQVENEPITDHCKVTKELEPLINFIDFNQIKGKILTDIIEPLGIIPAKTILDVYRQKARSLNTDFNEIRGTQFWDELACGSKLIIEENGKVVSASNDCHTHQG
ncbi:13617_t:CDS:1, partial [Rhizophagus irregularis]